MTAGPFGGLEGGARPGHAPRADVERHPARAYCTYFDSRYLARGLAMLRSLRTVDPSTAIHVLALDPLCARVLGDLFGSALHVISMETLRAKDRSLPLPGGKRTTWAYYATHKPSLALFTLLSDPLPASVTFLDADIWFFGDPSPMFAEIGSGSIGLSPHRLHAGTEQLARYGTYNAGCIYWRADDDTARQCVTDWRRDCVDWCREEVRADGRFMNQGYLNRWPRRYAGVHVIRHPGVNLAPWNIDGHLLARKGEGITVDGQPLIFYHYSGVMRDSEGQWHSFYPHLKRQRDLALEAIYAPYLTAVESERRMLVQTYGIEGTGSVRSLTIGPDAVRLTPRT
ncbi:MAG: hypothetical protein ACHQM4_00965 [Thermoanaerobaculia bacterium]